MTHVVVAHVVMAATTGQHSHTYYIVMADIVIANVVMAAMTG